MNELIEKMNFIKKIPIIIKNNYKLLITILLFTLLIFLSFQIYVFVKKSNILKASIEYTNIITNIENIENQKKLIKLSKDKNFYGTLSLFNHIKINIKQGNLEVAHTDILSLLNNKSLDKNYKSLFIINLSYHLLDKISLDNNEKIVDLALAKNIISKIMNLLEYIDDNSDDYIGHKLEIFYIISYINENNKILNNFEDMNSLYKKIFDNDKVTAAIKERVKNINDIQKYK